MLVKLEIAKVYDKLNWQFIRKMLEAFGFNQHWVINIVSSAFFSILVNGVPFGIIKPSRALENRILCRLFCLLSWLKAWGDLFWP